MDLIPFDTETELLNIAWMMMSMSKACEGMTIDEKLEAFAKHVIPAILEEE